MKNTQVCPIVILRRLFLTLLCSCGLGLAASSQEPLGSIVAWHRDFPNTPAPSGWVECNGQVIGDPLSPFLGQTLPDLNGEARFLRGGTATGVLQTDAFQGHRHSASNNGRTVFAAS